MYLGRYIEHLDWMKKHDAALVGKGTIKSRIRHYPRWPLPHWLTDQVSRMPAGFAAIVESTLLGLDTIELIQKSQALSSQFASSQVCRVGQADISILIELSKEVNFLCDDLLLHRKLHRIEELLILGFSFHCRYIIKDMNARLAIPSTGLGVSMLLSSLSSIFLAREFELISPTHMGASSISKAVLWVGCLLTATTVKDDTAWNLGQRLLQLCDNDPAPALPRYIEMCRVEFIWPGSLLCQDEDTANI